MNQKSSLHCIRNMVASASGGVSTTSPLFQLRQLQSTWETEFPMAGQALYYQRTKGGPSSPGICIYAGSGCRRSTPNPLLPPLPNYFLCYNSFFVSLALSCNYTLCFFFKHFFVEFGFFFRMSLACSKRSRFQAYYAPLQGFRVRQTVGRATPCLPAAGSTLVYSSIPHIWACASDVRGAFHIHALSCMNLQKRLLFCSSMKLLYQRLGCVPPSGKPPANEKKIYFLP